MQSFCIVYNNWRLVRVYKGQGFYSRKYSSYQAEITARLELRDI